MKRNLLLVAAVLGVAALPSCGQKKNLEERTEDFQTKENAIVSQYYSAAENLEVKSEEAMDSLFDITAKKIENLCRKTLKANRDNSLGVLAIRECVSVAGTDQIEGMIGQLKGEAAADPFIESLKTSIERKKGTSPGQMFTDFEVDGVKFSDFIGKGKVVLVDFWASWCRPCKEEIPNVAAVYEKYAGDDFDVLSVAVWDKPEDTKAAALEHGVVWNQIINAQKIPTDAYGIEGIPQIMLFGKDGTILRRDLRGEGIEEAVREALGR